SHRALSEHKTLSISWSHYQFGVIIILFHQWLDKNFFYRKKQPHPFIRKLMRALATLILTLHTSLLITQHLPFCNTLED
ncbi:hypothetical protein, partial [Escherichia coli]|uniref:hypothetical protein n=1 Tax=Escherichia coli TaxID=562 RepID=UPI001BC857C2